MEERRSRGKEKIYTGSEEMRKSQSEGKVEDTYSREDSSFVSEQQDVFQHSTPAPAPAPAG